MADELNGAGISAKERLANIEGLLGKIREDLAGKADQAYVVALDLRVRDVEKWQAEVKATARATEIEAAAANARETAWRLSVEQRQDSSDDRQRGLGKSVAVGSGIISTVVVAANLLPWLLR